VSRQTLEVTGPAGLPADRPYAGAIASSIDRSRTGAAAGQEWLLTDGLGGFAMGTVAGEATRRYHALLVASLSPPVRRVALLHSMNEVLWLNPGEPGERRIDLTAAAFADGARLTGGRDRLVRFELGAEGRNLARWVFDAGNGATLTRWLELCEGRGAAVIGYRLEGARGWLEVRPLLALRDFHTLNHGERPGLCVSHAADGRGIWVTGGAAPVSIEILPGGEGGFRSGSAWWRGLRYAHETDRGFDDTEDLFCPAALHLGLGAPVEVVVAMGTAGQHRDTSDPERRAPARRARLASARRAVGADEADRRDRTRLDALVRAADQFVVRRAPTPQAAASPEAPVSIVAGYPWFGDWGRDTMIALPGLLLVTGRLGEAGRTLETFALAQRDGLIPNRFSDDGSEPEYNTADASLWFLHACGEFAASGGDLALSRDLLLPACLDTIAAYTHGTRYRIGVDPADGLVRAGDPSTQLTWMDAARDGVVFTPRHGKPVELQALWHHGLITVAELLDPWDRPAAAELRERAARCAASIMRRFWSDRLGCMADGLRQTASGWEAVQELRPNQLLLASLEHSPVNTSARQAIASRCLDRLWTPGGVRTLDPDDPGYHARYAGPMRERDAAYHTGTAWPWLLGPLAEALLRAGGFEASACARARAAIEPALDALTNPAGPSLGQAFEVWDGDASEQHPGGCPAQAWSVAELLRVLVLIRRSEAARAL
jgi:predicted glycogen debranching enzyme